MFGLCSVWGAMEGKRMALPSVHRCVQLNQENQLLLKKLRHVRLKNKQLECDVVQLHDKLREQNKCLPACVTRKDVQIQTEFHLYHKGDGVHHKEHEVVKEHARVLQMYNELKKRYNKEVKTNQRQNETVAMLSGKINNLEHQLHLANQKINALEYKKKDKFVPIQRRMSSDKCMCKKKGSCSCKYLEMDRLTLKMKEKEDSEYFRTWDTFYQWLEKRDQLLYETQRLKMENETLSKERRMLKNELAALDKDFFDEIEDLKYALQEAIKLNTHYEKCLKKLSSTYGITSTSGLTAGNPRTTLWK